MAPGIKDKFLWVSHPQNVSKWLWKAHGRGGVSFPPEHVYLPKFLCVHLGPTDTKTGRIQKRLARPLCKNDPKVASSLCSESPNYAEMRKYSQIIVSWLLPLILLRIPASVSKSRHLPTPYTLRNYYLKGRREGEGKREERGREMEKCVYTINIALGKKVTNIWKAGSCHVLDFPFPSLLSLSLSF